MRKTSTIESFENGEITLLAIIESLIAISITVFISIYFDTYLHIVVSVSIAPFLLLRTQKSTEKGLEFFKMTMEFLEPKFDFIDESIEINTSLTYINLLIPALVYFLLAIIITLIISITAMISKIFAVLNCVITSPITSTLSAIPINWFKVVLCLDVYHPPEIIPGVEKHTQIKQIKSEFYTSLAWSSWEKSVKGKGFILSIISYSLILVIYLPSIIYRYSIKSTSIIYMPFFYILNTNKNESISIKANLICKSELEKLKRYYAWFVLGFFTAIPLLLWYFQNKILADLSTKVVAVYFLPIEQIDSWHIARSLSAVITLILFYYCDSLLLRLKDVEKNTYQKEDLIINVLQKLRSLLGLWTIFCGLYLLYSTVDWSKVPGINWLPF